MDKKERFHKGENKSKQKAVELTVTEASGLMDFLLNNLKKQSRNNIKSLLKYKEVFVDGRAVSQFDYSLKPGQKIRIVRSLNRYEDEIPMLDIIFENDEIIVINKPSGLLSIATEKEKVMTAYHLMTEYVKLNNPQGRIFVVHRLDRDTSGVLMAAKTESMKLALQDNWEELVTQRRYHAVVEGKLSQKSGTITSWLKETKTMLVYSSETDGDGLKAITKYEVIGENDEYSLLDIQLETGRKNQIRVHMKEMGNSVAGDKKYGARSNPIKRLALHSYRLELKHPFSGELMCFEAKTPKCFRAVVK